MDEFRRDSRINEGERGGWWWWGQGGGGSSASSFSFIYPTVSSGTQSIHSHAAKIEVITQKILEINTRGDSRINEGERGGWGE